MDWTYDKLRDLRHEIESGPAECSGEVAATYVYKLLDIVFDLHAEIRVLEGRAALAKEG